MRLSRAIVCLGVLFSFFAQGSISLPLHTLRDQGSTAHCWAYSMSHLLEARALVRDSNQVMINVEKDVKYWVDYERMMYIYRTKNDFYLGDYEGGWQIEYFEAFLKHGKTVLSNSKVKPEIRYRPLEEYFSQIPFMPEEYVRPQPGLPAWSQVIAKLKSSQLPNAEAAHNFAINYLNKKYGPPAGDTKWNQRSVNVSESAKLVLGSDYVITPSVESLVLVKPVVDGNFGWVKYLQNRYWGYRYDQNKIFQLIEQSLDNRWPVTFDDVYHAMTIIGYTESNGTHYYAVADSIPGKITWYKQDDLLRELNLLTFFRVAIPNALPPRSQVHMFSSLIPMSQTIDEIDNVTFPPQ